LTTVAIVQARTDSTRLPNKVMQPVSADIPMIEVLLSRLSNAIEIDQIILATSDKPIDQILTDHVRKLGYTVYQGSEDDVLDRYYKAALQKSSDVVVRITGDCPLVDPKIVDTVVKAYKATDSDYVSNTNPPTYPDGLDVEVFSFSALKTAWEDAKSNSEREHVTSYIRESCIFKTDNVANYEDYSKERWTVDEPDDYEVVKAIFSHFEPNVHFSWEEVMELKN